MDAISLIANIIAVMGAVRSAVNGIERLRRTRFAPQQLSEIQDELSNFHSVLSAVEGIVSQQTAQQLEDTIFIQYLEVLLGNAKIQLAAFSRAIESDSIQNLGDTDEKLVKVLWKGLFKQNGLPTLASELHTIRQI